MVCIARIKHNGILLFLTQWQGYYDTSKWNDVHDEL